MKKRNFPRPLWFAVLLGLVLVAQCVLPPATTQVQSSSYSPVANDAGKIFYVTGVSTFTLPAVPPTAQWRIDFVVTPGGSLTINPNGLQIDLQSGNESFRVGDSVRVSTDGTNYYTSAISTPPTMPCERFPGADGSLQLQACLVALRGINSIGGIADARRMTNLNWSVDPFDASSIPFSGVLLLPAGTIVAQVPVVVPGDWTLVGTGARGNLAQVGTTIEAGANFPSAIVSGIVSPGTVGAAENVVGTATGWTYVAGTPSSSNLARGCAFVSPAGGGANDNFGLISAINPGTQTLTLGWGANNGTGASAGSTYTITCAVLVLGIGGSSNAGATFGINLNQVNADCNNVNGCIGVQNWYSQQNTILTEVSAHNFNNIGFDCEWQCQNTGQWQILTSSPGSSCTANTINFVFRFSVEISRPMIGLSAGIGQCATMPNVGIQVATNNMHFIGADTEHVVTGIDIGGNIACPFACPMPARSAQGTIIQGGGNQSGVGTTYIHLSNAFFAPANTVIMSAAKTGIANNVVDDWNNCIITDNNLGQYTLNNLGTITINTSGQCGGPNAIVGPSPWVDVTSAPYGAKPDAKQTITGSMTSGSPTLTVGSSLFSASDVGKLISVEMAPVQQPAQPTLTLNLSGGSITCQKATNSNTGFTAIAVLITETNSHGEGQRSMERQVLCNNTGTVNQVVVTSPTALNGATTWSVYDSIGLINAPSGLELLDPNCTNIAIGTNCVLNTVSGATTAPPPPAVLITTIFAFVSATQVTLTANATQTVSGATVSWGTDNTTPIQNAMNTCPVFVTGLTARGCEIFLPPLGAYMVQNIVTTRAGVHFYSPCNQANIGTTDCASLWSSSPGYTLTMGTSGSSLNQGHTVEGIGFKDSSGTGNISGGLRYLEMTHSLTKNVSCAYMTNPVHGSCVSYDATAGDSQYNVVDGLWCIGATPFNCHKGIEFSDGQASNNWMHHLHIGGAQVGGDVGVDLMQNSGGTGANNTVSDSSIETYNVGVHGGDTVHMVVGPSVNIENSTTLPGLGIAGLIDTSGTNQCYNNTFIAVDFTNGGGAVSSVANCPNTTIRGSMRSAPSMFYFGTFGPIDDIAWSTGGGTHTTSSPLQQIISALIAVTSGFPGDEQTVTDAQSAGDCQNGGGSAIAKCRNTGSGWTALPGGGGGGVAPVAISSNTSIGATTICSLVNCPAGTYTVYAYVDVTVACATGGTYAVNILYTDDTGAKTTVLDLAGIGTTPATASVTSSLALSSTSNFGQGAQIIYNTNASGIRYTTTAGACLTGGPATGVLHISVVHS